MNSFEWFLLLCLTGSFAVGPWLGYVAGVQNERARAKRRVGRPE